MIRTILSATATATVTASSTPLVRRMLLSAGVLDQPNGRSSHSKPIPRGGGLACLAGSIAGVALAERRSVPREAVRAACAMAALGALDDWTSGLSPKVRLVGQIIAGVGLGRRRGFQKMALASVLLPAYVNVFNFMDGIDGISTLTCVIWGSSALYESQSTNNATLAEIGALVTASGLGFMPFNMPRARIFLGDVGSYFFGSSIAIGVLTGSDGLRGMIRLSAPLILYIVDSAQAIARRFCRGDGLFQAHRCHIYQELVDTGSLKHSQVAVFHAVCALACTLAWHRLPSPGAASLSALVVATYLSSPRLLKQTRGLRVRLSQRITRVLAP